jgi:hypothetical protein
MDIKVIHRYLKAFCSSWFAIKRNIVEIAIIRVRIFVTTYDMTWLFVTTKYYPESLIYFSLQTKPNNGNYYYQLAQKEFICAYVLSKYEGIILSIICM